jgi:hypothetical protein
MTLTSKISNYIEKHGMEIACTMMYISGNVDIDLIESMRQD